ADAPNLGENQEAIVESRPIAVLLESYGVIVLGNMDMTAMRPIRQGDPDRVNYHTPYPVAEGVRDYFSQNIVRAVDVGVEATPIGGLEQSAFDAFANIDVMLSHRLQVEEAAQGSVVLLAHHDADADQLRLVTQHLDEPCVGHEDEVLIGALAQPDG